MREAMSGSSRTELAMRGQAAARAPDAAGEPPSRGHVHPHKAAMHSATAAGDFRSSPASARHRRGAG